MNLTQAPAVGGHEREPKQFPCENRDSLPSHVSASVIP